MFTMKGVKERYGGFTLLEVLVVVGLIAILLGVVGVSYHGMGKGARMRGAINTLRATIGLARQQAILQGQPIELHFFESADASGYFMTNRVHQVQVGALGHLPTGVCFSSLPAPILFQPQGAAHGGQAATIELEDVDGRGSPVTITVYPLTGLTKL